MCGIFGAIGRKLDQPAINDVLAALAHRGPDGHGVFEDEQTRLTRSDELVGTPDYMAPEQMDPGPLTPAADIYALGLIMYEMLTARRPFPAGPTPQATVLLRRQVSPHPLRAALPDIDAAWEAAIGRCLQRDPDSRFARARDVIAALDAELPSRKRARAKH